MVNNFKDTPCNISSVSTVCRKSRGQSKKGRSSPCATIISKKSLTLVSNSHAARSLGYRWRSANEVLSRHLPHLSCCHSPICSSVFVPFVQCASHLPQHPQLPTHPLLHTSREGTRISEGSLRLPRSLDSFWVYLNW